MAAIWSATVPVAALGVEAALPRTDDTVLDDRDTPGDEDASEKATAGVRIPDYGKTWDLNGRPLTLGAKYSGKVRSRDNFSLGARDDDDLRSSQRLDVNLLYQISARTSFFTELRLLHNAGLVAEDGDTASNGRIQRGDTWIYFDDSENSGFGIQIGRQRFRDDREWWWDESLDAIRLQYRWNDVLRAQVAYGERITRVALDQGPIDATAEDVSRILGQLSWGYDESNYLETFFLRQDDHSSTQIDRQVIRQSGEDVIDADLTWVGLRATGKHKLSSDHRLYYWIDAARVTGTEHITDFDPTTIPGLIEADNPFDRRVRGWGVDAGTTWNTRWPMEPSFTFGYAHGSGDSDPRRDASGTDHAFRQTGLQDNNAKFRGVDRFRYYGELLRPELSNIRIGTFAVGIPLLSHSSLEAVWHVYRQVRPARFLRDARVREDRLVEKSDIGQELDLVLGLEEWDHLELEFVAAVFRAGEAYGENDGDIATNFVFKLTYEF